MQGIMGSALNNQECCCVLEVGVAGYCRDYGVSPQQSRMLLRWDYGVSPQQSRKGIMGSALNNQECCCVLEVGVAGYWAWRED